MELNVPEQVQSYLRDVLKIPALSVAEVGIFLQAVQQGGAAEKRLIESHLRLVVDVVEKIGESPLSQLDLLQEGNIGLMLAVKQYTGAPELFAEYATSLIKQTIDRAIKDAEREQPRANSD